jgi:hypothetical protein
MLTLEGKIRSLGRAFTMKLDADGLIVVFQYIIIVLHLVNSPQLHVTALKLDGAAHFDRRIAPTDVGSAAAHLSHGLRRTNPLNVGFGLRRNPILQAPDLKTIVSQHAAFLPSLLASRRAFMLSSRFQYIRFASDRASFSRVTFRFSQITFFLERKRSEKRPQKSMSCERRCRRKSYARERACFTRSLYL